MRTIGHESAKAHKACAGACANRCLIFKYFNESRFKYLFQKFQLKAQVLHSFNTLQFKERKIIFNQNIEI